MLGYLVRRFGVLHIHGGVLLLVFLFICDYTMLLVEFPLWVVA